MHRLDRHIGGRAGLGLWVVAALAVASCDDGTSGSGDAGATGGSGGSVGGSGGSIGGSGGSVGGSGGSVGGSGGSVGGSGGSIGGDGGSVGGSGGSGGSIGGSGGSGGSIGGSGGVEPLCVYQEDDPAGGDVEVEERNTFDAELRVTSTDREAFYAELDWDDAGNLIEIRLDADKDGAFDDLQWLTWDAEARQTGYRHDAGNDGVDDVIVESAFTADGVQTLFRFDGVQDQEGEITEMANGAWNLEILWDDEGRILSDTRDYGEGRRVLATWTYDENGNFTRFERDGEYGPETGALVEAADGTVDYTDTWTYDDSGFLIRMELDADADGTPDAVSTRTNDENGNGVRVETDLGGDGVDLVLVAEFDGESRQTLLERDGEIDPVALAVIAASDGVVDQRQRWTYDAAGNVTSFEDDTDADGDPEYLLRATYDDAGRALTYEQDGEVDEEGAIVVPADGIIDVRRETDYDAEGNVVGVREDRDDDGAFEIDGTAEYGPCELIDGGEPEAVFCPILQVEGDTNGDRAIDYRETWTYNDQGSLTRFEIDEGADGTPEYWETTDYLADGDRDLAVTFEQDGFLKLPEERDIIDKIEEDADGTVDIRRTGTWDCLSAAAGPPGQLSWPGRPDSGQRPWRDKAPRRPR